MRFQSERLCFKKMRLSDAVRYDRLATNADVLKYITGKALSLNESRERFAKMMEVNKTHPQMGFYRVDRSQDGCFVGLGKLVMVKDSTAEIGYSLLPEFWGKGLASEMACRLIDHARSFDEIKELIAVVSPENMVSKKLLSAIRFAWFETGFVNHLPTEIYKLSLR